MPPKRTVNDKEAPASPNAAGKKRKNDEPDVPEDVAAGAINRGKSKAREAAAAAADELRQANMSPGGAGTSRGAAATVGAADLAATTNATWAVLSDPQRFFEVMDAADAALMEVALSAGKLASVGY